MMTPRNLLRYALLGLGALLLVVAALAAYIAATFDPNDYKDEVAALVKRSKDRELGFSGPIRLSYWPNLGADLTGVTLSEKGSAAAFVSADKARASVQVMPLLQGRVVINGIDVVGLRANIRRDADGRFNFADLLIKPEEKSDKVAFNIASLRVRDGRIDYADASGTRLTVDSIEVKAGAISDTSARDLEASARLVDPQRPLRISTRLDKATFGDALAGSGLRVQALLEGKDQKADVRVELQTFAQGGDGVTGDHLKLEAKAEQAGSKLAATASIEQLQQKAGAVGGRGVKLQATLDSAETKLSAQAAFDRLQQKGRLLQTSPLQATVSGKAAGSSIDLKLSSPLALDLAQGRVDLTDMALRVSVKQALLDLDADLRGPAALALAGQTLSLPRFALDLTAASPKLTGGPVKSKLAGDLTASIAARKADLRFDGTVDGHAIGGTLGAEVAGTESAKMPVLRADLKARNVDIARVIARFSPSDLLTGKGDLDLKVTTRGDTAAALTQALNGEGAVALRDGAVKGLDINSSIRDVRATVRKALGKETGTTVRSKKTDFSEMLATFTLRDGVLDNRDLSLKSPLLRVAGAGTVDLVKGELDYGVKASVVATREGQGGAERSQLAGITVPVKLFGPLAAPQYNIDFAAMLTPETVQKALSDPRAAREAVKETTRDVREQVKSLKEGVKDLKGLFGH